MEHSTEIITTTTIQLRRKELDEIIIKHLKNKGFSDVDKYVEINFNRQAFSDQEDGLNAYDEMVADITIIKSKKQ
jgi:polyisoprenoid-binding protein YceI